MAGAGLVLPEMKLRTSSLVILPLGPVGTTLVRSNLFSWAILRTAGVVKTLSDRTTLVGALLLEVGATLLEEVEELGEEETGEEEPPAV